MLLIRLNATFSDNTLPVLRRDSLLDLDNGGVRFLFDLGIPYSFPGTAQPANNDPVKDLAELANGRVVVPGGGVAPSFTAGKGFDFTPAILKGTYVEGPAAALADIWSYGTGRQHFLVCMYLKLPAQADFNPAAQLAPVFSASQAPTGYQAEAELVMIGQQNVPAINARRQTAVNAVDQLNVIPQTADYGQFSQLAYWRNASGTGLRLKNAAATRLASGAAGVANAANFSAQAPAFGLPAAFTVSPPNGRKFTLYRGFIENLGRSARDPVAVLDADWARVVARGTFS